MATLGASGAADLRNRLVKETGALARREVYADGPIVATKSFTDADLAALVLIPGEELPIGREGFFAVDSQEFELGPLGASYSFSSHRFSELNIRPEVGKDHNACVSSPSVAWANLMAAGLLTGSMITPLGGDAWADTRAMTSVDGSLYVIQNGKLWRASPGDGSYTQLGGQDWDNTAAMTAGPDDRLYVVQNGKLWRARPEDGKYDRLHDDIWKRARAMAFVDRRLYIIHDNRLWQVKLAAAV